MRILITGAYGFVGKNLSSYLASKGHQLVALDVARTDGAAYSEHFTWDDLSKLGWQRIDAVVHLAGKAHDTRGADDPGLYQKINVGLTEKIVEALLSFGGERPLSFVLFSSVKAVADQVEGILSEEAAPAPKTAYGLSKLAAEQVVLSKLTGRPAGTRYYILRPCMIHGPGNKGNLNLLYGVVSRGLPWPLGAFENRRSMASVDNVCAVVEGLLSGPAPSGVYQVADDEVVSTNELIGLMAAARGRTPRIWRLPAWLFGAFARVGDVFRLPLNSERLKKLTESYIVSNAKIKAALGWERMPVRAADGLRKTLASFVNEQ